MRKQLLFLFLIIATIAYGRKISENEAASIASGFLGSSSVSQNVPSTEVHRAPGQNVGNDSIAPYYIFNATDGNGFVIVSGDDRLSPILGYSDTGNIDTENLPVQLKAMLDCLDSKIASLPETGPKAKAWRKADSANENSKVLTTAKFDQHAPFNALCPVLNGVTAPLGCGGTALAIALKYYEWPEKGNGYNNYYPADTNSSTIDVDFSTFTPDWSKIKNDYSEQYTDEEAEQVSELCYKAATSLNTYFTAVSGSSTTDGIAYALPMFFGYTMHTTTVDRVAFEKEKWENLIKEEIDAGRIVIYNGVLGPESGADGHLFICDGYDNNGLFHVNWGWGGLSDGFYELDDLNFNYSQRAIINIKPQSGPSDYQANVMFNGTFAYTEPSQNFVGEFDDIETGTEFPVNYRVEYRKPLDATIAAALIDKDRNIKEVCELGALGTQDGWNRWELYTAFAYETISFANSNIIETDSIALVVKESGSEAWRFVREPEGLHMAIAVRNNKSNKMKLWLDIDSRLKAQYTANGDEYVDIPEDAAYVEIPRFLHHSMAVEMIVSPKNGSIPDGKVVVLKEDKTVDNYFYPDPYNKYYATVYRYGSGSASFDPSTSYIWKDTHTIVKYYTNDELLSKTFTINAGEILPDIVSENEKIQQLTLSGTMQAQDFKYISGNLPLLTDINLEDISITGEENDVLPSFSICRDVAKVILPKSLKKISRDAFYYCDLERIDIPATVTEIEANAFRECRKLRQVVVHNADLATLTESPFNSLYFNTQLFVPVGSKEKFEHSAAWSNFTEIIEGEPVLTNEIILNETSLKCVCDDIFKIEATVCPENATDKRLAWSSSDDNIVTVNSEGNCRAINAGICCITARALDGSNAEAVCEVTVCPSIVMVTTISLNPTAAEGKKGEQIQINATVLPENATNKDIRWSSSDERVASVDDTGLTSLLAKGSAVITASAADDSGVWAECAIVVTDASGVENILTDKTSFVKIFNQKGILIFEGEYADAHIAPGYYIVVCEGRNIKIKAQ